MMVDQISTGLDFVNLLEIEERARPVLEKMAFDYFASGANDEVTLAENRDAFDRITLYPYMLRDVSKRSLNTTVLGQEISFPVLIAPTAFHKLAHPDGEVAVAKAAQAYGTIMCLSTLATSSMEEVSENSSGPRWFQLYVYKDKAITEDLVRRAEQNGYSAIVFTVDAPLLGRRERDVRNRFCLPPQLEVKNLAGSLPANLPQSDDNSALFRYIAAQCDASITWEYVDWLRSLTSLPVLVKGILRADDALLAIEHGASGIIVSNHGGRQLDTAPSTISALGPIVDAVGGRAEVFVDGGFRRGTDVLKALCLGARAVLLGRPVIWGLALAGQAGVERVLKLIREELELSMALCGCASVDQVDRSLLSP